MLDALFLFAGVASSLGQPPKPTPAGGLGSCDTIDYVLGAVVTFGILAYLIYALIRAENF